jgi:hypothetical protein
MMRKKTFLLEPEWMTIPFMKNPKLPFHELLDILLQSPALMDRGEEIKQETNPHEKLRLSLKMVETTWELDEELEAFYKRLQIIMNAPLYWPVPNESAQTHNGESLEPYQFEYNLHFLDVRLGSQLMLFWAAQVLLFSGMCELYELIDQLLLGIAPHRPTELWPDFDAIASRINQPPLGHRTEFIIQARQVCQSVEFCVGDFLALPVVIAPLSIISQILLCWPGYEREVAWARKALVKVRLRGVEMARHFPSPVILAPETCE